MGNVHFLKTNIQDLSTAELKDYTYFIFQNIRESLKKNLHFDLKVFGDWQVFKSNDFRITFKGKAHFLNVKMRGYQIKTKLEQGFLINFDDLLKLGVKYDQLPFYNDILNVKEQLSIYKKALPCYMHLVKIYVYFGLNESTLHYFLTFDTGDSILFISDIPEMKHQPIEFMRNVYDGFYLFVHSQDEFKENLDKVFFNQYKKHHPDATNDDFLIALMNAI